MAAKVLRFFPAPVVIKEIDGAAELNAQLERLILDKMSGDPGVKRSNSGGWHSNSDLFNWTGEAGQRLLQAVIELANAHTKVPEGFGPVRWSVDAWANVNQAGDANKPHVHGGCYWSGAYYVKTDGGTGGGLILHDPRMPMLRMHAPSLRLLDAMPEQAAIIRPESGQLILFPSWLEHSVEPWEGSEPRISIAINLKCPQRPTTLPAATDRPARRKARKEQEA